MNIFILERTTQGDIDWVKSAQSQDDLRVVKMTLETAQLLCSAINLLVGDQVTPYRTTHKNHPSSIWARQSFCNWSALKQHGIALAEEYTKRFGKRHKCLDIILSLDPDPSLFPQISTTPPPAVVPDEYKSDDIVQSYRRYWVSKANMRYNRSNPPQWFLNMQQGAV